MPTGKIGIRMARPVIITTQAQLNRLGKLWQKRLELVDYPITFKLVEEIEKNPESETLGASFWDPDEPKAEIKVIRGAGEDTLAHEVLHVRIGGHKAYEGYNVNEERSINAISRALLKGYRS